MSSAAPPRSAMNDTAASFYDLVRDSEKRRWDGKARRLSSLEVDHQVELGRKLDRQLARFLALENAVNVDCRLANLIDQVRRIRNQPPSFTGPSNAKTDGR